VDFNVPLGATQFQPNAQYCVNSSHHYEIPNFCSGDKTTEACTIVNQTRSSITNVFYEQILSVDPDVPIDANPNDGGGLRIFPDKKVPQETISRRRIRVKAQHSEAMAGKKIYFRSFDVDDPSADTAPIDTNDTTTQKAGGDNNGNVDGTSATSNGRFLAPLGSSGCETFPQPTPANPNPMVIGMSCLTDTTGFATVDFELTMQPGDNFTVVASDDEAYITGLALAVDGINLTDTTGAQIPASTQTANACTASMMKACRADMLTVWRRLHIEVDSMDLPHGNFARGNVTKDKKIHAGKTRSLDVSVANMDKNRFENGRLELAPITNSFEVISNTSTSITVKNSTSSSVTIANSTNFQLQNQNGSINEIGIIPAGRTIDSQQTATINISGTPLVISYAGGNLFLTPVLTSLTVISNTTKSIKVKNNGTAIVSVLKDTNFRLYDDDDMDDEDASNLNGDEGDAFREPDLSLLSNSDLPSTNVFAPAYIRPVCCLSGSHERVPYFASPTNDEMILLLNSTFFQNIATEADVNFWTIYILGGYQPPRYDIHGSFTLIRDGDPKIFSTTNEIATVYGASNAGSVEQTPTTPFVRRNLGQGAILFMEVGRPTEYPTDYRNRPIARAYTVAHEVGHLFRGVHADGDLMAPTTSRTIGTFSAISLSIIRKTEHP
jgi:hypothetical protein